jgi:hypothetical protein
MRKDDPALSGIMGSLSDAGDQRIPEAVTNEGK